MKKTLALFILAAAGVVPASAQWAVFDIASLQQNITNYSALTKQIANQAAQINHQIQQIRQMETQLQRVGDMADFRKLTGFAELRADIRLPTQIRTWADRLSRVDGRGLFGDTRGGVFQEIGMEFLDFDGGRIARDPQIFIQSHDVIVTVDEFKIVQDDVYVRRKDLKQAIGHTSEAMQAATTEAEHQKLQSVLEAQYNQLAAIDAEVALSAAEVQVKAAEASAMKNAQRVAETETRRRLAQQEVGKVSSTFVPIYECMLQYVTERRLSP
jgi:hypothetical protein